MTVRVCPKCRTMLTESSTVCINCGTRFKPSPTAGFDNPDPPPAPGVNPDWAAAPTPSDPSVPPPAAPCGHQNPPGQTFCLTCGASIPAGGTASAPPPGPYGAPPPAYGTPPPYGAGGYGTAGYGAPPPYQPYYPGGPAGPPKTHTRARNALILGIVGLVCCGIIFGPAAIYEGSKARKEIAASPFLEGDGMAIAGIVLGIVGLALTVVWIAISIATENSGY